MWLWLGVAALGWAGFLWRLSRPGQSLVKPAIVAGRPTDAHSLRCLFILAVVTTVYSGEVRDAMDSALGVTGLTSAMTHALLVVGAWQLAAAVSLGKPVAAATRIIRVVPVASAVSVLLMVGAALLGQPQSDLDLAWGHPAAAWVFWLTWLASFGAAVLLALVSAVQAASADRSARAGAVPVAVAAGAATAYIPLKAVALGPVLLTGRPRTFPVLEAGFVLTALVMAAGALTAAVLPWAATHRRAAAESRAVGELLRLRARWDSRGFAPGWGQAGGSQTAEAVSMDLLDQAAVLGTTAPEGLWPACLRAAAGDEAVALAAWADIAVVAAGQASDTGRRRPLATLPPFADRDPQQLVALLVEVSRVSDDQTARLRDQLVMMGDRQ